MYWAEFLTVALIHLLAVASPGPDFAVVVRESVTHGRRAGTWTAFGVGTAIFLHVGYSLLGIGLIVSQSIMLFNALKWAAAAYLVYIGFKALRARPAAAGEAIQVSTVERTPRAAYIAGFMTNGLNPKATCSSSPCSPWSSTRTPRCWSRLATACTWPWPPACGSAWSPCSSARPGCGRRSPVWATGSTAPWARC